jgi:hypothetical protein
MSLFDDDLQFKEFLPQRLHDERENRLKNLTASISKGITQSKDGAYDAFFTAHVLISFYSS